MKQSYVVILMLLAATGCLSAQTFTQYPAPGTAWIDQPNNYATPTFTDIDGDGLLDLVIGNSNGYFYRLEQNAVNSLEFTQVSNNLLNYDEGSEVSGDFADLDGDGRLDFIVTDASYLPGYEQDAIHSSSFTRFNYHFLPFGSTVQHPKIAIGDLNGDGLFEILRANQSGDMMLYQQDAGSPYSFTETNTSFLPSSIGTRMTPEITDIDNDGLVDILIGERYGHIRWWEQIQPNSLTYLQVDNSLFYLSGSDMVYPACADVNGDGFIDVAIGDYDGNIYLFLQDPVTDDSKIFISEVSDNRTGQSENTAFIELLNFNPFEIDLGGYKIVDDSDGSEFTLPAGTSIPAHEYLVISGGCTEAEFIDAWGIDGEMNFVQGDAGLGLATVGHVYNLDNGAERAVIASTPVIPAGGAIVQETPGVWVPSTPDASTPGGSSGGQALPVELSSFTAVCESEGYVRLDWVTQSETDMTGYYILRAQSAEAADAQLVSPLVVATNTSQQADYTYRDIDVDTGATYCYWLQSVEMDGSSVTFGPVSVTLTEGGGGETPEIPLATALHDNFPNPFNPSTTLRFSLAQESNVRLEVFNVRGQCVAVLIDSQTLSADDHEIVWNAPEQGSGVYFARLTTSQGVLTKKMLLMK